MTPSSSFIPSLTNGTRDALGVVGILAAGLLIVGLVILIAGVASPVRTNGRAGDGYVRMTFDGLAVHF